MCYTVGIRFDNLQDVASIASNKKALHRRLTCMHISNDLYGHCVKINEGRVTTKGGDAKRLGNGKISAGLTTITNLFSAIKETEQSGCVHL